MINIAFLAFSYVAAVIATLAGFGSSTLPIPVAIMFMDAKTAIFLVACFHLMTAIGGMNLTTTVEGRERYPVRIRYMRELRDTPEALNRIFIPAAGGEHIPLAQIAELKQVPGPAVINSENTLTYTYNMSCCNHHSSLYGV